MRPIHRGVACRLLPLALAAGTACSLDTPGPQVPDLPLATYLLGLPDGWIVGGQLGTGFSVGVDTAVRHGGARSATILGTPTGSGLPFFAIGQPLRADAYRGRRIRLSAWIRTRDATTPDGGAVLWLRVDGGGVVRANDAMQDRRIRGTTDWAQYSVVLDVPDDATGIIPGVIFSSAGQAWFDDLRLEVVGSDVATTAGPLNIAGADSAAVESQRALYARYPAAPVNLDFEGARGGALDAGAVAWLKQAAVPFDRADPAGSLADLEPLRAMVGGARMVALGEGTHGTREFFQMKHRVLQFLVRELGFTAFAIEATWPEANAVDLYVRTGIGDPAVALSNLYFWTWNTQEVAEMIAWMRDYNRTVPPARQVRFFGFDMQYPGVAMDTVAAFVRRADLARAAAVDSAYACLAPYRNYGVTFRATYSGAPAATRSACRAAAATVDSLLVAGRARYAAAGADDYARARQSARLVVQWEDMAAQGTSSAGSALRDRYMAENARWLLDGLPAGSRMMLWAHNGHVNNTPAAMGGHLRRALGADYLVAGFAFGGGSFNAVEIGSDGTNRGLHPMPTSALPAGALEAYLAAVGAPRLLLDARRIAGAPAAAPLAGPLPMRSIGAGFTPGRDLQYFVQTLLPGDYDLLIYFATTTPSTLLPFRFQ
jgi:erythromycin esterase